MKLEHIPRVTDLIGQSKQRLLNAEPMRSKK